MKRVSEINKEDGSTLVETLVAMAILVSVLLPTSLFLGYIAANPLNKEKITAVGLVQNDMEQILATEKYWDNKEVEKGKWTIKRTFTKKGNLVQIKVVIYRKNEANPIITLNTERLVYEEESSK